MFLSYEDSAEFELYHLLYIENPEEDRAGKPIFPRSKGWSRELGRAREGLVYFPCSSPSQSSTACAVATAQVTGLLRLSRAWPELPGCGARSRFSVRELMPLFFFLSSPSDLSPLIKTYYFCFNHCCHRLPLLRGNTYCFREIGFEGDKQHATFLPETIVW